MLEEQLMAQQEKIVEDYGMVPAYVSIPYFLFDEEVGETVRKDFFAEFSHIIWLYNVYKMGMKFMPEGSNADYVPSKLRFRKAAMIMNKEARFLFSNPPTFNVNRNDVDGRYKEKNAVVQEFLDKVLELNNFNGKLLKALKDCFIGKRVAIVLNFNEKTGITITFLNSLEFIYEMDDDELVRFVTFHKTNNEDSLLEQRWFKKAYEKRDDGVYLFEAVYSGNGDVVEIIQDNVRIKFDYIPAIVVLNEGLTGDDRGTSELELLVDSEGYYSKLSNADMDALRKSMNPVRYTIDASQKSTEHLPISPGSYWDVQSDDEKTEEKVAKVGIIEPQMNYSGPLKTTLERIENDMYNAVDVPNITSEQLAGVITSGKTIQALYWGLTVRCDEKMLSWGFALQFIALAIIEGGRLYPNCIKRYTKSESIPEIPVSVLVENNYPIPQDQKEEKETDLTEVEMKVRSKKSYIKKWQKLNDEDAESELEQIQKEQDMFENSLAASYNSTKVAGTSTGDSGEEETNQQTENESKTGEKSGGGE